MRPQTIPRPGTSNRITFDLISRPGGAIRQDVYDAGGNRNFTEHHLRAWADLAGRRLRMTRDRNPAYNTRVHRYIIE
ncbi:MAG: hypothetical protein LC676_10750 [Loktanella sp.]|nr:hypothetical protein [Loktanella sp.]